MEGSSRRERRRYIGFRVDVDGDRPPDRRAIVDALDQACRAEGLPDRRRLTVFTGDVGIARCPHTEIEATQRALTSIEEVNGGRASVETLVTSGTIKKVKAHLGIGRDS
jgi:RNase P/RNase MRP subunit POP5